MELACYHIMGNRRCGRDVPKEWNTSEHDFLISIHLGVVTRYSQSLQFHCHEIYKWNVTYGQYMPINVDFWVSIEIIREFKTPHCNFAHQTPRAPKQAILGSTDAEPAPQYNSNPCSCFGHQTRSPCENCTDAAADFTRMIKPRTAVLPFIASSQSTRSILILPHSDPSPTLPRLGSYRPISSAPCSRRSCLIRIWG